ncbi:MAG TPA: GumC family protein [Devosia sp.]|nr:GumC family protein [Devosia sp.]
MAHDDRIDLAALLSAVLKRLPRVALVTALLVAAAIVLTLFMPRLYESSASILVEPRNNIYTRASNEQVTTLSGGEAGVVSSQIELIKSRDTLLTVIDRLDLRSVPEFNGAGGGGFSPLGLVSQLLGRQANPVSIDEIVLNNLYARLTVSQERDSRIISVQVRSADPQLAADIANAVANAHVVRRASLSLSDTAEASSWLADEIAKLRVSVSAAETAVANFKVDNDLFVGANNTSLADQQLSTIATQISAAQERKNTALSRAALIRGMIGQGQPIDGVADVRQSPVIEQLSEEKARLQGEKAQRSATLLDNHPVIRALNAQIAELNNQMALEGRRVANALDAEAQIEADLEASLQAELGRAKSSASTATQDTVTLDGLEREAKAQRDLLEGYLQRYTEAVSRTDSNSALPDVRVVSVAAPSVSPASPNTQLILIAVAAVSLLLQIGAIVFAELVSGRAVVAAQPPERAQDELDEVPFVEAELEPEQRWEEPAEVAALDVDEPEPAGELLEDSEVDDEPVLMMPEPAAELAAPEVQSDIQRFTAMLKSNSKSQADPRPVVSLPEPEAEAEAEAEAEPESEAEPEVVPIPVQAAAAELEDIVAFSDLASDLVLGRTHLLILAAHASNDDCAVLAEELVADALARGLSVALVDAGSGRPGEEAGLTDLSIDAAGFGDVVQKSADNSFAEVAWGQQRRMSRQSNKPLTLVEALGDIYEVVVLMTGRVGVSSTLPLFDGVEGRLVLVAGDDDDLHSVEQSREQLLAAGFDRCEVVAAPARVAA